MENCKLLKDCKLIGLRKRQILTIVRTFNRLKHYKRLLTIAGTGYGKTYIFTSIIKLLAKYKIIEERVLVISNRLVLLSQINNTFEKIVGCSIKLITSQSNDFAKFNQMTIQTYMSLKGNRFGLPKLDLLIIDEAHFSGANGYKDLIEEVIELNPNCIILGYTATPIRSDKKSLFSIFECVADDVQLGDLVDKGLLTKSKLVSCYLYDDYSYYERVYKKYIEFRDLIKKPLKTIIYCGDIKECEKLYEIMKPNEKVGMVHSNMDVNCIIDDFQRGKIDILINVRILVEGFDSPEVNCILICKEVHHLGTLIQMVGRACRLHKDKDEYYCLDFKDNFINLMPEEINFMEHIPLKPDSVNLSKLNKLLEGEDLLGLKKAPVVEINDPDRCFKCHHKLIYTSYCYHCVANYIGIKPTTTLRYRLEDNTIKEYNSISGSLVYLYFVVKGECIVNKDIKLYALDQEEKKYFTILDVGRLAPLSGNGTHLCVYLEIVHNQYVWFLKTGFSGKIFIILENISDFKNGKSEVFQLLCRLRCLFLQVDEQGLTLNRKKVLTAEVRKKLESFNLSDNWVERVVNSNSTFLTKCVMYLKKLIIDRSKNERGNN